MVYVLEEKKYHNYPDSNVTKNILIKQWFPMSQTTLNRRLKEIDRDKRFKDVKLYTGGKVLINVRGFYQFLCYRQEMRFK